VRAELVSVPTGTVPLDGCDHFYNGREEAIQAIVSSWPAKALHLDAAR
jgi:hypothetical protein